MRKSCSVAALAPGMSGSEIEVLGYRGMREYALQFEGMAAPADAPPLFPPAFALAQPVLAAPPGVTVNGGTEGVEFSFDGSVPPNGTITGDISTAVATDISIVSGTIGTLTNSGTITATATALLDARHIAGDRRLTTELERATLGALAPGGINPSGLRGARRTSALRCARTRGLAAWHRCCGTCRGAGPCAT